jgi:hypothetical protein
VGGGAHRRTAAGAALLAAACAGLGCPEEPKTRPAAPDAQPAASSRGVKVPLEDGWSARLGPEQSLTIGPPGRVVLRIDLRPGAARQRPGPEELVRLFRQSFSEGQVSEEGRREEDGFAMVRLALSSGDGGGARSSARLGAKAVGDDLFLCASAPGATDAELEAAERACEGIAYSVGP